MPTDVAHSLWPIPRCVADSAGKDCALKSDHAQITTDLACHDPLTVFLAPKVTKNQNKVQKRPFCTFFLHLGRKMSRNACITHILQDWSGHTHQRASNALCCAISVCFEEKDSGSRFDKHTNRPEWHPFPDSRSGPE